MNFSGVCANLRILPTFILGNYISLNGKSTLTITAIPEGAELAMIGLALLGILGALIHRSSPGRHTLLRCRVKLA